MKWIIAVSFAILVSMAHLPAGSAQIGVGDQLQNYKWSSFCLVSKYTLTDSPRSNELVSNSCLGYPKDTWVAKYWPKANPYGGWFQIVNVGTGKCISVGTDKGATSFTETLGIVQLDCNDTGYHQVFKVWTTWADSWGKNWFMIAVLSTSGSEKCISVNDGMGAVPYIYTCDKAYGNQWWSSISDEPLNPPPM